MTPPMPDHRFLQRLSLEPDADERAIKRAYARELKQIDQEHDAAGFQLLRQAYETALAWVKNKPADTGGPVSFAPAAVTPVVTLVEPESRPQRSAAPARAIVSDDSPGQLAQAVFDDFRTMRLQLVARGQARDAVLWRYRLKDCLDDERLLNIEARAHFEFYIARLLTSGWESGHESLFVAARKVFDWDQERRRLDQFGQLGAWLNQAVDECAMFEEQQSGECEAQAAAIVLVRNEAAPSKAMLAVHAPALRRMAARFPAWVSIIAGTERIEQWLEVEASLPEWRKKWSRAAASDAIKGLWKVGLLLIALLLLFVFSAPLDKPRVAAQPPMPSPQATAQQVAAEESYRRAAGALYMEPGTRKLAGSQYAPESTLPPKLRYDALPPTPPTPKAQRPSGRSLSDAELKAIDSRIQFEWAHTHGRMYTVDLLVELDDGGAVKRIVKRKASGLPALDQHVEDAIRETAPFKAEVRRTFGVTYSWGHKPVKQKAGDAAAEAQP